MPTTYAIPNGATQFAASTYTGTGSAMSVSNAASKSGISFQPDLIWIKQTNNSANHVLADSSRGVSNYIFSNLTNQEAIANAGTGITSFASNGFNLGTETSTVGSVNAAGGTGTYVAWQWKASNAVPVTNNNGTTASQVNVNQTAGFSIVTFTKTNGINETFGHGLLQSLGAPKFIILRCRTINSSWFLWNTTYTGLQYINFDTNAVASLATIWNSTAPTDTVLSMGTAFGTGTYVAYAWQEIAGFSKFGSYTGTGNTNGAFVYLGFKPRFIMIKQSSGSTAYTSWFMIDTTRMPNNIGSGTVPSLWANLAVQQGLRGNGVATDTINYVDILSNGFKIRSNASDEINNNTSTYIYAAFAENPFKYANAQ